MVDHNKLKQLLRIKFFLNYYHALIIKITDVNLNLIITIFLKYGQHTFLR